MVKDLLSITVLITIWWGALFVIFSGLGLLVRRSFGLRVRGTATWLRSFWMGWAVAILILQLWHLWFKIDGWALVFVSVLGGAGLIWNRRELWPLARRCFGKRFWSIALLLLLALWLSNRATGPMLVGDTGTYHVPFVKWATSYPIVPGLGNLHGRLAFNSSFFLYAAMLDVGPFWEGSHYLANGLLLLVILTQVFSSLGKLFSENGPLHAYYLFNSLLLAPILAQVFGIYYPSLSPDLATFVLGIVLSSQVLLFIVGSREEERYGFFCIAALACVGIATKLSFALLGVTAFLVAFAVWAVRNGGRIKLESKKTLPWVALCGMMILLPWMLRGVILSGYVAYPSTFGSFSVDWQVPRSLVIDEANWIRSWARAPGAHWIDVLGNWNWLAPWFSKLPESVTQSLQLTLFALILALSGRAASSRQNSSLDLPWLFLMPPLVSLVFWFVSAPDPRFAWASFWILAAGTTALGAAQISCPAMKATKPLNYVLCLGFFLYVSPFRNPLLILPGSDGDIPYSLPQAVYETKVTDSGARVNIAKCWNTPLPCAPDFRSNLRLVAEDDIGKGFLLDETITPGFVTSPDLSVVLVGADWPRFEEGDDIRWMRSPGRLLVYARQAAVAKVSLKPHSMNVGGEVGYRGRLGVTLNGAFLSESSVETGIATTIPLLLRPDFNIVTLELAARNFVDPDNEVSVSFYPIEITSEISDDESLVEEQVIEATKNEILYPSLELGTLGPDGSTGWSAYHDGYVLTEDESYVGSRSLRIDGGGGDGLRRGCYTTGIDNRTVADGESIAISVYYRVPSYTSGAMRIYLTGMENGILKDPLQKTHSFATATTDDWNRAVATYRNNSGVDWTDIVVHLLTTDYAGTVYLDAIQYEFRPYPTPYCDGSLGDGHAWGGDGTPHANTSGRTEAVRSGNSSKY